MTKRGGAPSLMAFDLLRLNGDDLPVRDQSADEAATTKAVVLRDDGRSDFGALIANGVWTRATIRISSRHVGL
jgi:hypothetical protein